MHPKRQTLRETLVCDFHGRVKQLFDQGEWDRDSAHAIPYDSASAVFAETPSLRNLLDDVAKLRAFLAASTSVLAFGAATRCLASFSATPDSPFRPQFDPFQLMELHRIGLFPARGGSAFGG